LTIAGLVWEPPAEFSSGFGGFALSFAQISGGDGMPQSGGDGKGEVLFEFVRLGGQLRVSAIDAASGVEVIIVAPLSAPRSQIEQIALAKLRRKMANAGGTGAR
jgi:hypothetical protein